MCSVVKPWLGSLTFKMQTVLLSALRGCDGKNKEDPSKHITRFYRNVILNDADSSTFFMHSLEEKYKENLFLFLEDLDSYPVHFLFHLLHGFEIISYYHPEDHYREIFESAYERACIALHLHKETKEELESRLKDNF